MAEASEPDGQAVIHSRRVGALIDLDGGELAIDVVRRDDLCLVGGIVGAVPEPAWVRVAGVRIARDQAIHLARLLVSAQVITEPLNRVAEVETSGACGEQGALEERVVVEPMVKEGVVVEPMVKEGVVEGPVANMQTPGREACEAGGASDRGCGR